MMTLKTVILRTLNTYDVPDTMCNMIEVATKTEGIVSSLLYHCYPPFSEVQE